MAKVPILNADGVPLVRDGVPAVSEVPCNCCGTDPCVCWRTGINFPGWSGCNLPWAELSVSQSHSPDYDCSGDPEADNECRFEVSVSFDPPEGVEVISYRWYMLNELLSGCIGCNAGSSYMDPDGSVENVASMRFVLSAIATCHEIGVAVRYRLSDDCETPGVLCSGTVHACLSCCQCFGCTNEQVPVTPANTCTYCYSANTFPTSVILQISGASQECCNTDGPVEIPQTDIANVYILDTYLDDPTDYITVQVTLSPCCVRVDFLHNIDGNEFQCVVTGQTLAQYCCPDTISFDGRCEIGAFQESVSIDVTCGEAPPPPEPPTPPPPPPPPPPDCSGLDGCGDIGPAYLTFQQLNQYGETGTDPGFPYGTLDILWFLQYLNGVTFELQNVSAAPGLYGFRNVIATVGDYGDPGIRIGLKVIQDDITYPPPDNRKETYWIGCDLVVTCEGGLTKIDRIIHRFQHFIGAPGASFPEYAGETESQHTVLDATEGVSYECGSSPAYALFGYDQFDVSDVSSSRQYSAGMYILGVTP